MSSLPATKAITISEAGRTSTTWSRWYQQLWKLLALPLLLFFVLPIGTIFVRLSPEDVWKVLQVPQAHQALSLSLITATVTTAITSIAGTPLAYLIYRRRSPFTRFIETLIELPSVLPPSVAGVALLLTFGRNGWLGQSLSVMGIQIPFTPLAVVLAQLFIASPLYVKSAALGFASIDCEVRKAAALDGANRWQILRYIVIPLSWQAIVSGLILTWARAIGEFGATILFAGNLPGRTQTMPIAIYIGFETSLELALTLSAILVLISFGILILLKTFLHASNPE